MDRLKKARKPLRASVTRTINEVENEVAKDEVDADVLQLKLSKLEELLLELTSLDQKILDLLLDGNCSDEEYEAESTSIEEYQDKVRLSKLKINKILSPRQTPESPVPSEASAYRSAVGSKRNYKLPKIEIKKYNGELTEWLSYWSQFKKIHEDEEIDDSDKFQYLVQSIEPKTRARVFVESYPQTAENYPKVIEELKDRFGNKKLLKQVYVRELLKMVVNNNISQQKVKIVQMYDRLVSHLRALESLDVTKEQTAVFLYPMVESSLPEEILIAWQRSPFHGCDGSAENPPKSELDYLMQFLKKEVENEGQRALAQNGFSNSTKENKKDKGQPNKKTGRINDGLEEEAPTVAGLFVGDKPKCVFCEKLHDSRDCWKAAKMTLAEKKSVIQSKKYCLQCIRPGHFAKNCKSWEKCLICGQKHLTLMCPDLPAHKNAQFNKEERAQTVLQSLACSSKVILGTLKTAIFKNGQERPVRLFYDCGSQRDYITTKKVNELQLMPIGEERLIHSLFGGIQTEAQTYKKFQIKVKNAKGNGVTHLTILGKDRICGDIPRLSRGPWMKELKQKKIWLNDLGEDSLQVDILLGAPSFGKLLTGNIHQLQNGLTAIETVLGWTLMGECQQTESVAMSTISMYISDATVEELWKLETLGIKDPVESKSKEERELDVKEHFLQTVSKTESGRYSVSLPWINGQQQIPDNRKVAEKRLESTTKKLIDTGKYYAYDNIFKDWLREGLIEEVIDDVSYRSHYLPHRAVFKPQSLTTPIRPVFDASSKAGRTPSLNDCLEKGPNQMELIPSILIRFRSKREGCVSDIRKAFQMIEVNKEDRDYLRFLWWEGDSRTKLKIYRHNRVVFGVNCSPFLLAAVIDFHLSTGDNKENPVAQQLLKSLYVDNCITSVDSKEEYEIFKEEATRLMAEANMDLRLWQCSSGEGSGVGSLGSRECGLETGRVATYAKEDSSTTVLGLRWDKREDTLSCDFDIVLTKEKLTKREVLSCIHKIFDPLGFLAPALLCPKLMLQESWELKLKWDDELPEEIKCKFTKWFSELHHLKEIKIPRNETGGVKEREKFQLHTFCDACRYAYAAVTFLRTESEKGVCVQLLQAKARVKPLKKVSIPRLELMGCTIGTRLSSAVKKAMDLEDVVSYYWSDSTTAISWIQRNDEWGTFVGNRVKEILQFSRPVEWNHVPGEKNPADLPSRGCTPKQLLDSRWWEGCDWLKGSRDVWPITKAMVIDEDEVNSERKRVATVAMTSTAGGATPWYARKSSFYENCRTVAWMRRFIAHLRKGNCKRGWLTVNEIKAAEDTISRLVQKEVFPDKDEIISGIRVERDEDGLIHVKTKLLYRNDTVGFKYPILLPREHPVVHQIIEQAHKVYGHSGVQFVMGKLREKFWIIQGRKIIRKIVKGCPICRRYSMKKSVTVPAPLPEARVNTGKVFETVGADLFGPLILKDKKKVWVLLVTCAVYRCVHLEIVESLSTEDLLNAFTKFCDMRGRPSMVYSDNGTNFVGAVTAFKAIDWEEVTKTCGLKMIQWRFNPPSAAWWGGWWERLVRSVKGVLRKVMGNAKITEGKLRNYLSSTTAIINGRPLTTVTEDPEDLIPLTPAMFMYDIPMVSYTDLDFINSRDYQYAYKERSKILDDFKKRFRKEYLGLLVQRQKEKKTADLRLGDVVLVGDDNKKRWQWPIARIVELIRGRDGNIRVVKIKTPTGYLTRPVQRIYPLEVSSPSEVPALTKVEKKPPEKEIPPKRNDKVKPVEMPDVITRCGRKVKAPKRFQL